MPTDLRESIRTALSAFADQPLRQAATALLDTLGYRSDRTLALEDSKPEAFLEFIGSSENAERFDKTKALFDDWASADLLFQLTGEELSAHDSLFRETEVRTGLHQSYLFFAIELNGASAVNGHYARGKLTAIARQINRVFPMPVMVLIKHTAEKKPVLSIAVINRRRNQVRTDRDVLEKVTVIRDIALGQPHRGHLDILDSLAVEHLRHPDNLPIDSFDALHAAWEEIFNVELLNKRFYRELANWYFWALPQVDFPADLEPEKEKRRATGLIRLLTRLIFCWFLKEKGLIPEKLFRQSDLGDILADFDPGSEDDSSYYHAILQNLFFATLNQRMGKPKAKDAVPYRQFALDQGFARNRSTHDLNNLYRYESHFAGTPEEALAHFADIPFLNGGLFECLDRRDEEAGKTHYIDGFSRNPKKRPAVPNRLFFSEEIAGVDLSATYGDKKRKKEKVSGLLRILDRYKFTIQENTPIDQEIALDPELLGKVFENLLASYNEETKTTARKQTGSFYTPRPIVDYMVDESLKAHLAQALADRAGMEREDAEAGLDILFAYTEKEHAFAEQEIDALLAAIHDCKILDPACGSGAFPMGVLHKLVTIIHKLDPDNRRWKRRQLDAARAIPDTNAREAALAAIEDAFENNADDYGRKLYLIENCLYGVDIQPIAIQISKLRFFISLVCDQQTNRDKSKNHGIRPLPNLETKFVAADTLIGLPEMGEDLFAASLIAPIEKQIEEAHHQHFTVQNRQEKLRLQRRIQDLRHELAGELEENLGAMDSVKARHLAAWDPFDPQASSDFFDPHWMFGRELNEGFDVVIGNPPYVQIQKFPAAQKAIWQQQGFQTYAATADIYCLFYERGAQLLREGGSLIYITSNKWMRAGYGKKLRGYFSSEVDTESVLDFGMAQNFGAATTYTCITRFYNQPPDDRIRSCYVTDDRAAMDDPAGYFAKYCVEHPNLSENAWVVLSKDRQRIKTLVEEQGVPLEEWDLQINYGIKTGLNEAFYLTAEQRDALIAEDPASEELIVPLLRGRFVERYATSWDGEYMINSHNGIRKRGIPMVDVQQDCPAIWRHLCQWEDQLIVRQDQGDHWSNLRNCAYIEEFSKPKIIYPNMTKFLPFYFDGNEGFYTNQKCFIITSSQNHLGYLTAVFNSSLFRCCFRENFPELLGNSYELSKIFMEKIPLKKPTAQQAALFGKLVPLVQSAKRVGGAASPSSDAEPGLAAPDHSPFLESLIDAYVMECYFREHMAERDLLFHDDLAPHLDACDPDAPESAQRDFLANLVTTLNAPTHPIRQRLDRIPEASPDLLAVIQEEGKV